MQTSSRSTQSIQILDLAGSFDTLNAAPVRKWFEERVQSGHNALIVNMKNVTFLDSTGLSALVFGMKRTREAGGEVRLCALQQPVRMVFELTRLDRVFEIFNDEEDAVRAFSAQSAAQNHP